MALPSSSSTSRCNYDVFLSFRGEDTRTNFSDHLYDALKRYGIRVFRDDNELERGEEIRPELLRAIENSRCFIVVFSKNYASSTWCLDELAYIMMCKKKLGRMVLPVFYHVKPEDVRKRKRSFGEAFAGHEERFKGEKEKVEKWRNALREAASLSGEDVGNRYESSVIADIVKGISHNLGRKMLKTALNPIGLDYRADKVMSLLNDKTKEVLMVGIHGMGGLGKTTVAKEVFNRVCQNFQGSCFLADVREKFDQKGIVGLIKQLLSETLKGDHEKVYNEHRGLKVIEERLCSMRVLIVLDDVDKWEQVDKILGDRRWLFPGSRIIVTTRRKDLLEAYPQYQVAGLNDKESLWLLCINAFNQWHPKEEYMECTKSVVNYVGGIPLALIVLGKFLAGKSVKSWKVCLKKLRVDANEDIQKILEISFHSLDDAQRNLFLDIACFFIGEDKDCVTIILDGCRYSFADDGIDTLVERCLVEIGSHNEIVMHDLLRDMGREIVRKENSRPEKRKRVWCWEDASDMLLDKMGTNKVEGLSLNAPESSEFSTEGFIKMTNLRLLQLNNINLNGSYDHISKKLRSLCWHKCPLESMPADLYLDNVVALDMRYNSLTQGWEEAKFLRKLKVLDLSYSCKLTSTPNFEGFPNLEILMLKFCAELVEVHESIGGLSKLVTLNLRDCRNLKNLPRSICALRSLENLNISGCSELDMLSEELGNMNSLALGKLKFLDLSHSPKLIRCPRFTGFPILEILNLQSCTNLVEVHKSIGGLTKLVTLNLKDCRNLKKVPCSIASLRSLQFLVLSGWSKSENLLLMPIELRKTSRIQLNLLLNGFRRLFSLRELNLQSNGFRRLFSLRELNLPYCNLSDLMFLEAFQNFILLNNLNPCGNNFFILSASISLLPKPHYLGLSECKRLQSVSKLNQEFWVEATITSLERENLTNWQHQPWMDLDRCSKLVEIEGSVKIINHLTGGTSWISPPPPQKGSLSLSLSLSVFDTLILLEQGFYESGMYNIFLRGSESPSFFNLSSTGDPISFEVPPLIQGCKIVGFIFCAVYAWDEYSESCMISPRARIDDVTKMIQWIYFPKVSFFLDEVKENIMWLSYWRIEAEIEGGNQVMVHLTDSGYGNLKNYGVRPLYQQNEQADSEIKEPAMTPMSFFRGGRWHSKHSAAFWARIYNHKEICRSVWKSRVQPKERNLEEKTMGYL